MEHSLEDGVAVKLSSEPGAEKEGPGELAVEGVALLGRRGQTVVQEDRDQSLDLSRRFLSAEIEQSVAFERLSEN